MALMADAWRDAGALRGYLTALVVRYGEAAEFFDWIEWIRAYVDRLDPLNSAPVMPEAPDASPEDLKPFLAGFSPHGPSGR